MLDVLIDSLTVLALLAALAVIGYVFLVVRALYAELKERGIAPELLPRPKTERRASNPVRRAQEHLDKMAGGR